jgi:hypothetical protein
MRTRLFLVLFSCVHPTIGNGSIIYNSYSIDGVGVIDFCRSILQLSSSNLVILYYAINDDIRVKKLIYKVQGDLLSMLIPVFLLIINLLKFPFLNIFRPHFQILEFFYYI